MDTARAGLHGAISRQEAIARFGTQEVRRRHESGRWYAPWEGVLVDATRVSDPLTIAAAAVLLGGPGVALTGPTAMYVHGCRRVEPLPAHLIVPYGHWLRSRVGLVVHNGRKLDADQEERHGLPVLCIERVLADMLCRSRPPDALAVLDEALAMVDPTQRESFRAAIARRLQQRSDPRGRKRGAQLLDLATGDAASPAESWFLFRIADSGFPAPEVNWWLCGPDGRRIYCLDYAWPHLRIAVEYNGYAYHAGRETEDERRAADLRRRGWIVITVTADDLARPERFEAALQDAFRQRGVDVSRRTRRALQGRRHRESHERRRRNSMPRSS